MGQDAHVALRHSTFIGLVSSTMELPRLRRRLKEQERYVSLYIANL